MSLSLPFRRTLIAAAAISSLSALTSHAMAQSTQSATQLDEITVTAGGYEQSVKDAPASITVITADEIAKKSYTDVTDVLKNVPGIHIQGGGVEQSVMIRGMSADYTLFLVDGRPQQDNQAFGLNGAQAGTPINFLPPLESIERIEVVRGPASSLYGSNAIGGVVNIITKKVVNKFSGSVTTEYIQPGAGNEVTNAGFQTSMALNLPIVQDLLSLQLTGAFRNQDEADFVGGGDSAAADPKYQLQNFGAKASLKVNAQNAFTFGATRTTQERSHNPGKSLAADAEASYSKSVRNNLFATHEGRYKDMLWESYVSYDTSENPTRVNATTGNSIGFDTLTANTQATFFLGKHTLTGGANYKSEKLMDGASNGLNLPGIVVPTDVVTMERDMYALFLEDNWRLTDDLSLLLSGRYDYSEDFGGKLSPKVYAVYDLTPTLALKGGMTTGYKTPSLRNAATDFGSTSMGGVVIGNPDLKPETTRNFEIGLNYGNANTGLAGSLTVYRSKFKDKLLRTGRICEPNVVCQSGGVTYPAHQYGYTLMENVDSAELKGLEWTADWKVNRDWTYRHSYTYAKTEQTSGTNAGKPLNDIPEHMFNTTLDWRATHKLNVWTQLNFRGKTSGRTTNASGSSTNDVKYPAYTFVDVGLVYAAAPNVKLRFGVYNLTNKVVTPEEGFAYVLDGRRYSASMTVQF
ncbi:TonB-dependent receptor [Pantoea sp. 18069]|uniref:TonB-dependent receptor domain-containing protein n=1 Tax=Pantoea sp. 18069 TaxID=2681415 RepID=UPI00135BDBB3|nr:TonB-dependent receptor [Pantoea sp. 18069]